ncbi:glycosyltransferase family 1 protein [Chamaesiphon sp. VAR_48_metabat_135_sub]|uniref:glycosyltransferase family 4 protein n=1 Tax=Chamaesiphon sp. VAR_48_metabat_135_sub TaxID=2964699 RepID=UPI00286D30FD|nr:glycosyltransferase family 1 protein [Chamaesiphon sp. VAR_48_metabat_135_sub]
MSILYKGADMSTGKFPLTIGSNSSVVQPNQPFASARAKIPTRQAIALISEHGDPAAEIGKDAAGGQNVYVRQVGESLAKLGWQVDMFTRKSNPNDETIVQHTPHCRTIRLTAGPECYIPRDELFQYMPEFVTAFQKFQQKEGTSYPLAHTNYWMSGWVGLELQRLQNIQLIHTYHSLGAVKYQSVSEIPTIAQTRLAVEKQILEQAHSVVATSPQEMDDLETLVSRLGKIDVIPCGTDVSTFRLISKAEARKQLGISSKEKVVLYVGRFDKRKGIETLVRATGELRAQLEQGEEIDPQHLKLLVVGGSDPNEADGAERQRIEEIVSQLDLTANTEFVGMVGHDRLALYYTAADVCVIPSHYEPFGLVAIEAMACGTPVVASAVGGLKFTVISEETGLLVPPHDVSKFAHAIGRILTDDLWARKIRKQASTRVQQNFSWTGVAIQLSDLYRHLLAQSLLSPGIARGSSATSTLLPKQVVKAS